MTPMPGLPRQILCSVLFVVGVLAALTLAQRLLSPRLQVQATEQALAPLRELLGGLAFDNDPRAEATTVTDSRLGPGPQQVYPGRWIC
jgi:hypothetical protein